jgi:HSP20 family protein
MLSNPYSEPLASLDRSEARPKAESKPPEHALPIDVIRRDGAIVVRADVPGCSAADVMIGVDAGVLALSGKYGRRQRDRQHDQVLRRERRHGSFSRTILLPEGAEADSMAVSCRNGVLELTLPTAQQPAEEGTVASGGIRERSP